MYPTISHLLEDIFGFSIPLPIQTFGFFVATAIVIAAYVLILEIKRKETCNLITGTINKKGRYVKPSSRANTLIVISLLSGIIGAKLFSILEEPRAFSEAPFYVLFSGSGFTYYGGLIFGSLAAFIYSRRVNINVTHLLDAAAPALLLGYAIGRIGCHLSGDGDWGIGNISPKPEWLSFMPDKLWAYNYPHNVIEAGARIQDCNGPYCMALETPVFPTPLYETIICVLLFVLLWVSRKKIIRPGIVFSIYLLLTGAERLLIEQIRVDSAYYIMGSLFKQSEIISAVLIIMGCFCYYFFSKNYRNINHNYQRKI